jgi:ParB family chromosome partitioning protein
VTALTGLAAIPVGELRASPINPRDRLTGIDELASSIRENGLIQPIIVQRIPGVPGFQIIAGHRRHAAVRKLGLATVLCVIRRDMLPDEELLAMLVENGQRADLDPIEEARALNRLKAQGMTQEEIARKIGRSGAHVSNRLLLLALPTTEQEELRAGITTITNAVDIAKTTAGRIRPRSKAAERGWHLSHSHPLGAQAKARCLRLHKLGRRVGGTACGECWETVIRADERTTLHDQSANRGRCVLCDHEHDPDQAAS